MCVYVYMIKVFDTQLADMYMYAANSFTCYKLIPIKDVIIPNGKTSLFAQSLRARCLDPTIQLVCSVLHHNHRADQPAL